MRHLTISRFPALGYACDEAVNTLCTNLSFSGESIRKIMITSCRAGEGKSFVSMNILRTMASLKKKVVLVDSDLRRSNIHRRYKMRFDGPDPKGLTHLLAGMAQEDEILYETDIPGAYYVYCGRLVSNSLMLLNSPKFHKFLDHLAERFDYVIVDVPPIGALIDAAEIAKSCDGTLLVINYNEVRKQELIDAYEQLRHSGCQVLGTVINKAEFDSYLNRKYYYKSYYTYYYNRDEADEKESSGKKSTKKKLPGSTGEDAPRKTGDASGDTGRSREL